VALIEARLARSKVNIELIVIVFNQSSRQFGRLYYGCRGTISRRRYAAFNLLI
jgi:hypothetical protein